MTQNTSAQSPVFNAIFDALGDILPQDDSKDNPNDNQSHSSPVPAGLFLYAAPPSIWPDYLRQYDITAYQPLMRQNDIWPDHKQNILAQNPVQLSSIINGKSGFEFILLASPHHKTENHLWINFALSHIAANGHIIICAANDAGGKSLEKDVTKIITAYCDHHDGHSHDHWQISSITKHKCRAVCVKYLPPTTTSTSQESANIESDYTAQLGPQRHPATGLWTMPGIFGWDKIDRGSAILHDVITSDITQQKPLGKVVADFGCGNGFLLKSLQERRDFHKIKRLYAFDNDARALYCAQRNIDIDAPAPDAPAPDKPSPDKPSPDIQFIQADCTHHIPNIVPIDAIIMNPPFHDGKKSDTGIGQSFITNAARHLRAGGRLYMVANRHLAYEKILQAQFGGYDILDDRDGFKVFACQKSR